MRLATILLIALASVVAVVSVLAQRHEADAGIEFGRTPTATPTSRGPTATPTPAPPPRREGPASDLHLMATECRSTSPTSVRAVLLWGPARAGTQYVDLSIFNNGFAPGTFVGLGPLGSDAWGFVWDGLLQGTPHYIRVNTQTATGWQTSATLSFFTPVCNPALLEPAPAPDMLRLRDDIAAAAARWPFNTAVAITDLRTGETIDVNGYSTRLPGCTLNLFALIAVASDLQQGRYPEPAPGDLIGQTINRSDPITARTLMKYWLGAGDLGVGLRRVNDLMHSLGMNDTLMDHPPAFMHESLFGVSNRTTARDTNKGLKALWDGRALGPSWRDYMLRKMTLVKPGLNYLIPAGVGSGATASHKNGFLYEEGWADNDIGIVWFERGGQRYGYAISFFTQYVRGKYDDIPLGQQVSGLAYRWLVSRYGSP